MISYQSIVKIEINNNRSKDLLLLILYIITCAVFGDL